MLDLWIAEPNPPRSSSNRTQRRKSKKRMARRRTRNRRGRFSSKGSHKRKHRKNARRRSKRRASGTHRKRRRSRRSNAHSRRHRSHASTAPRRRRRRRNYQKKRGKPGWIVRRSNPHRARHSRRNPPPYKLKDLFVSALLVVGGFASTKLLPFAVAYFTGDNSWNMGAMSLGLHAGSTVLVSTIAYFGVKMLTKNKQKAAMVSGGLLTGGIAATLFEVWHYLRKNYMGMSSNPAQTTPSSAAPPLKPAGTSGMGRFTPQQLAQARSAAKLLQGGQGNFSPAAFGAAGKNADSMFSPNERFN